MSRRYLKGKDELSIIKLKLITVSYKAERYFNVSVTQNESVSVHLSMIYILKMISFPLILMVKLYQWFISPIFPPTCRYTPCCSSYMIDALRIWGPFKGTWMGIKRLISCRPGGGHGYDPVPPKDK
jgi:putative membrane protein insertion efficiency factor